MKYATLPLFILSLTASNLTMAHQQGDLLLRVGATTVTPNESTSNIIADGNDLGFGLRVDGNTQLGVNAAYFLTDNINIELLAATPFTHDINFDVENPLGTGNKLGEVTHLPPTLSVNYYFAKPSSLVQPYLGAGLNYTFIFDEEFSHDNTEAGLTDLSLDGGVGLSAQVGMDIALNPGWHVNASVRWIDINSEASFKVGEARGAVREIEIDPWVYTIAVGIAF